jgi:putative NADH-flavin reductase
MFKRPAQEAVHHLAFLRAEVGGHVVVGGLDGGVGALDDRRGVFGGEQGEHPPVYRVGTAFDQLALQQRRQGGLHRLRGQVDPPGEFGGRDPGLPGHMHQRGELGGRQVVRTQRLGHEAGERCRTGRLIVEQALENGHHVTAAVRNPDTRTELHRLRADTGRLRITAGDVRDPRAVRAAVQGQEAVVSAVASRGRHPHGVFSDGTRTIVDALRATGVRRFLCISSRGVNYHDRGLPFIYRAVLRPLLLRDVYADMTIMEEAVRASDLDWTLIRPPRLVDSPARGTYRVEDGHNPRGGWTLSRADLAAFVVAHLGTTQWTHRTPTLAY